MKAYPWIEETRREFIREKRRQIKLAKKIADELTMGCSLQKIYDGTGNFEKAVYRMKEALKEMDGITKLLR